VATWEGGAGGVQQPIDALGRGEIEVNNPGRLRDEWVAELATQGWSAVHWSTVGDPSAEDSAIMACALANGFVVLYP
jgi:hypothetical protein